MDSISLKSSTKKAMLTKRSINYYRISGNIRESLRLEEQSCSLHKPQQQCLTLTMKPGCSTLLKEYMKVKVEMLVTQSCLILCDPTDCSPLGSFVHGVLYQSLSSPFRFGWWKDILFCTANLCDKSVVANQSVI